MTITVSVAKNKFQICVTLKKLMKWTFFKSRMKMWVVAAFDFSPLPNTDCEKI